MAVQFGLAIDAADHAALGVRAQELLLSRPAEGLPDQPVRAADRRAGAPRRDAGRRHRQARRHHARAPRGGRRQVAARRACRRIGDRPEPRRHAADRDRLRAGHALGEGSRRLHEEGAHAGALPRHLRRQHAGRLVPLRRERVDAPQGRGEIRHPRGTEEPELVPLRREGDQPRSAAPDRDPRSPAARWCRRRACTTPTRTRRARCARRKRRTTTATSPTRTCCPSCWRSRSSMDCARGSPSCRTRRPRASQTQYGLSAYDAQLLTASAEMADFYESVAEVGARRARSSPRTG